MTDINSGWVNNPEAVEEVMAEMAQPYFFQAADVLKASGKGKEAYLYKNFKKLGIAYPSPIQTTVGDCFNGDAKVTLADGSTKEIKDVKIGDKVITPVGNIKCVLNTFKKPYNGKMLKINTQSYHKPLICTPDHKLIEYTTKSNYRWNQANLLEQNNYLLIPKLPNIKTKVIFDLKNLNLKCETIGVDKIRHIGSSKITNRYIKFNEKVFWLFGIFLAEGSVDTKNGTHNRITFNLSSNELILATKIKTYIKDIFDLDVTITQVPSKPSVLYVRITSAIFAHFIKNFCFGNVWTKCFHDSFKLESESHKLALLEGWIDGDGWKDRMGVTTSKDLAYQFFDIANSLGMNVRLDVRKAYKQSKESYGVNLNTDVKTRKPLKSGANLTQNFVTTLGKVAKIKSIEEVDPIENFVYCIEVADDHAFICDGYAVHNCVSHATSLAGDALAATEIANGERESWIARSANEYFYHVSRVVIGKNRINGDGSINAWAAKGFAEYGSLRRIKYNSSDLTEYSPKKSRSWGMSQIPKDLYQIAKLNNIGAFAAIKNFGEAADSLFNNYPIIVASNQGFSSKRDKDGFCAPSGTWGHSMAVLGYKDDERPGVVICNSWPSFLPGTNQWELPPSAFFCDAEVFDRMCRFNDTFSLSGFNGFKPKIDARVI
jgi:hypothetical protein